MNPIDFFDAKLYMGDPFMKAGKNPSEAAEQMAKAGIGRAVAVMYEQEYAAPNQADAAAAERLGGWPQFYGLLTAAPSVTGEVALPDEAIRRNKNIAGALLSPKKYRIPQHPLFLADWFEAAERLRLPMWFNADEDGDFVYIADVLTAYPALNVVLGSSNTWPNSRKIYPLAGRFPGVYICLSDMYWMGAIEDCTRRFGAGRMVFSTGWPERYMGSAMLMLRNADISEADKAAIASGNIDALIGGIERD